MAPKLSVCMIVRDEADVLPRCLASIKDLADEIIAVDTGSTDGSQAILAQAGAQVVDFPWQDDFGAARTHSLRQATGDWVLVLDADEALDPSFADHLRALLIETTDPISYDVAIRSYLTDEADPQAASLTWMPRLFSHPQSHLYLGRVHEQLIGSLPVRLDSSLLLVEHWGYQPSRVAAKGKWARNDHLLDLTQAQQADDLTANVYQAISAPTGTDRITHGMRALEIARESSHPQVIALVATSILQGHLQLNHPDAVTEGQQLLSQYPLLASEGAFLLALGQAYYQARDWAEAAGILEKAVEHLLGDRALQSYWNEQTPLMAILAYADTLLRLERRDEAILLLERSLAERPMNRRIRAHFEANLAKLQAREGHIEEALAASRQAIEHDPDLRFKLANVFLTLDQHTAALAIAAPVLDAEQMRDRTLTVASSLLGDPRGPAVLDWYLTTQHDDPAVRRNLGLHWLALGDPDRAAEAVALSFETAPHDATVMLQLAFFEEALGRASDAEARLAAVTAEARDAGQDALMGQALTQWANLAFHQQEWDKATDLFDLAINLTPQEAYLHFARGLALANLGETAGARMHLERALALEPEHVEAMQALQVLAAHND